MLELTDNELQLINKSLSITYDAYTKRLDRLTGNRYQETVDDIDLCNQTLDKIKTEQQRRRRNGKPIYPIGVTPPEPK